MVDRFTSAPLELPGDDGFERADLIFYSIDHSGASFEARLFHDSPKADHTTTGDDPHYLGSFFIFGHGGCAGDPGHCDLPTRTDPYDLRPPHQLLPAIRVVTVTDQIKQLITSGQTTFTVTVVAHTLEDQPGDVLAFDTIRLATYADAAGGLLANA